LPLYPYRCTKCGFRFEKIQKYSDEPEKACPECGGALERPLTAPGLQFKGAGWYVNDYAPKGGGSSSGDAATAEKKPETKPEAKSESKTETKTTSGGDSGAASATPSISNPSSSAAS
jgi:putative FmdB family regulatory protein